MKTSENRRWCLHVSEVIKYKIISGNNTPLVTDSRFTPGKNDR